MNPARAVQLACFAQWTPAQRLAAAGEMAAIGLAFRERRLRSRFPHASERELGFARVREVLGLPPGVTPP